MPQRTRSADTTAPRYPTHPPKNLHFQPCAPGLLPHHPSSHPLIHTARAPGTIPIHIEFSITTSLISISRPAPSWPTPQDPVPTSSALPRPPTPHPRPEEGPVVPEPKLGPVVREAVVAPEAPPDQFVVPRGAGPMRCRAEGEVEVVGVFAVGAEGLDVEVPLGLEGFLGGGGGVGVGWVVGGGFSGGVRGCGGEGGAGEPPSASQGMFHHVTRQSAVVGVQVLLQQVVHDVDGFGGCEEGDAGAVAEEAEVAVVRDDVHGGVPGDGGGGGGAGPDVVDGADVDAAEAEAGAVLEHVDVSRVFGG